MRVPDNQGKKLDAKSTKFIFVGYPEDVKGFKLYDRVSRKFIRSNDVMFPEKIFMTLMFKIHRTLMIAQMMIFQ